MAKKTRTGSNTAHNHFHNHCLHKSLAYCSLCDVAYCLDCCREWGPKWTWTNISWPDTTAGLTGTTSDRLSKQNTYNTTDGSVHIHLSSHSYSEGASS